MRSISKAGLIVGASAGLVSGAFVTSTVFAAIPTAEAPAVLQQEVTFFTFDSDGCASHGEVDQLQVLMSTGTVRDLFDTNGTWGQGGESTFNRHYESCWAPATREVVVWFDNDTALSVRWDIRDT